MLKLIDKREISEEQWKEFRRAGIGGSDAAAILGLNPYASPLSVYYDKVNGNYQEKSLPMEIGIILEPFLRQQFQNWMEYKEGHDIQVQETPFMLASDEHPFMIANLDGQFEHPELGTCGLELKTTGEFNRPAWEDKKVPDNCYIQVQHYMAVTGLKQFYVAVLVGNKLFHCTLVNRDEEVIDVIKEHLYNFWQNHILKEIPPGPSGLGCDANILTQLYPNSEDEEPVDLSHCYNIYLRYKDLKASEKLIRRETEEIKQKFMSELQTAEVGYVKDKKVTWKRQKRKGYTVEPSVTRVLRIN